MQRHCYTLDIEFISLGHPRLFVFLKFCSISFYNVIYEFILDAKLRFYFIMNVKIPATSRHKIPSNDKKNCRSLQQITNKTQLHLRQVLYIVKLKTDFNTFGSNFNFNFYINFNAISLFFKNNYANTMYKFMRLNVQHIKHMRMTWWSKHVVSSTN